MQSSDKANFLAYIGWRFAWRCTHFGGGDGRYSLFFMRVLIFFSEVRLSRRTTLIFLVFSHLPPIILSTEDWLSLSAKNANLVGWCGYLMVITCGMQTLWFGYLAFRFGFRENTSRLLGGPRRNPNMQQGG